MLLRPVALLALILATATPTLAQDYESQAEARMKLSFDMDEVDGMLERRKAMRPSPPTARPAPRAPLPLEPNSTVEAVTVFRDRAVVERTRSIRLDPGQHTVTFEGLPPAMLDASLNAAADGATLLGVEVVSGSGKVDEQREAEIEKELRVHIAALGEVRDRLEALLAQRTALRRAVLAQGQNGPPPVREIEALLQYVDQSEARLAKSLREQEERAKELDERIRPLLVKLNNPIATGKSVRVEVRVAKAASIDLDLRYAVVGAGWTPAYDLRYDPDKDQVSIGHIGVIQQSTGERWEDAAIALSTASPDVAGSLPILPTWRLGEGQVGSGLIAGLGGDTAAAAATTGDSGLISEDLDAEVTNAGTVVFRLPGKRTIIGDGSAQRLPLGVQRYGVETALIAAPRAVDRVFREGTVRLGGSVPILAGTASTYVDGQLVGTGPLRRALPGESLQLSLGTDDRVRVSRQIVERRRDLSGRKHRYTFRFELEVVNPTERARKVELRDVVPISENTDVDVRMLEGDPPAEPDGGDLRWTLSVPAGGRRSVGFGFTVVAPADLRLPELDRML